ncbi:DUF3306 domain-containing protein [Roseovarius spongiae]|uniref:DUF3306 domain-containing protein n=1 Tax=Roseovarius spongiae TaxID=2320272 RepID=A0A3A8ATA9_9RHOB|nr:DUF3306 domain-containing protein [Roseovarius spongiae]RKF12658.1 DUF3306 domain-containing protein [Roseovarius spongiae]
MPENDSESRLNRWSRRKRERARQSGDTPAMGVRAENDEPEESEAETLNRLGLPDPAALSAGDDFSGFLRADVPPSLRRRALRTLWRVNPALARLDGLVDYDDDYTDAATVPETLRTAWEIGNGFAARVRAPAREREAEPAAPVLEAQEVAGPVDLATQEPPIDHPRPTPRRMRFALPEDGGR